LGIELGEGFLDGKLFVHMPIDLKVTLTHGITKQISHSRMKAPSDSQGHRLPRRDDAQPVLMVLVPALALAPLIAYDPAPVSKQVSHAMASILLNRRLRSRSAQVGQQ
jgi:hypothetical protein